MERAEERGVGWLVKRGGSASVGADEESDRENEAQATWESREGSRVQSSIGSQRSFTRKEGRRGSWVGGVEEEEVVGPDFVDVNEEEGEGEVVDEGEMRRVVWGRVGGWVDWAVGWMDVRGEGEEGEGGDGGGDGEGKGVEEGRARGEVDAKELRERLRRGKKGEGVGADVVVVSPPEQAGVWNDAKWLFSVASKAAL